MPLKYSTLMALPARETVHAYTARDTMLYAIGIGAAIDADTSALKFIYEDELIALPSMAVILGYSGEWLRDPYLGLDWKKILHGEQSIVLHKPIPIEGEVTGVLTIEDIYDKGAEKGAVMYLKREIFDNRTGDHIASDFRTAFLRGDGGCGGRTDKLPAPHPIPTNRQPDISLALPTRTEQALIYRLSGDYNPLHSDPAVATQAGFSRPILHGLCTYGVASRALLSSLCQADPRRIQSIDARFSSPVFPGETIVTEIWNEESGAASFRAKVAERDVVVLNNGLVKFN